MLRADAAPEPGARPKEPMTTTVNLLDEDRTLDLGSEARSLLPAPVSTEGGRKLDEVIMPSGRVVRLALVKTAAYLAAKERAAATAGDPQKQPDPRGERYANALNHEICSLAVVSYTAPLDWGVTIDADEAAQRTAHEKQYAGVAAHKVPPFVYVADPKALCETIPESAWRATTPLELLTPGEDSLEGVFSGVADWECLTTAVGRLMLPKRDLSGIVGKGRSVTR